MPKAIKEWGMPAIVLSVLAAVFSAGGTWAIIRGQAGQVDTKADKADVDRALAAKADRSDVASVSARVTRAEQRLDAGDQKYQDLLVEVKDRLARIETKVDRR